MSKYGLIFDHVHLISEDPQGTASWYADNLGGKIVLSQEVRGAPQFHVAFNDVTVIVRGRRPGEDPGRDVRPHWGNDHFGFHVTGDFDCFCAELKEKGVRFSIEPVDFSPNLRIAFLEGPDGVSIELLQRKR